MIRAPGAARLMQIQYQDRNHSSFAEAQWYYAQRLRSLPATSTRGESAACSTGDAPEACQVT